MKQFKIIRSSLCRIAAATAILLGYQGNAFAKCDADWFAIDENRDGDVLALTARNLADFPITYSVRIYPQAASNERRYGRSRGASGTLEGRQVERLMTLSDADISANDELSISCTWTIGSRDATHDDDYLYMLPYASGTSYRVIQGFDSRFSHSGVEQFAVDFKMDIGTPVHAAREGVVARVEESNDKGCWQDGCGQYANFIVIMHNDGTTGEYYHLQQNGALVEVGERVEAGQRIGLSGNTGHTALPHLHFAVYKATRRALPQSVPVAFASADGVVYKPRRGQRYLAVSRPRAGD